MKNIRPFINITAVLLGAIFLIPISCAIIWRIISDVVVVLGITAEGAGALGFIFALLWGFAWFIATIIILCALIESAFSDESR